MCKKILWVDDEPFSLDYESALFEKFGFSVKRVTVLNDALDLIFNEKFYLIITDMVYPLNHNDSKLKLLNIKAGIELIKALRSRPTNPEVTASDIPIIVYTALTSMYDNVTDFGENITVIEKPIHPDRLLDIVKKRILLNNSKYENNQNE